MYLKDAASITEERHVKEAAKRVKKNGVPWVLAQTGREKPKHRYIVIDGQRYPTKAFGFLVAQIVLETDKKVTTLPLMRQQLL